MAFDDNPAIDTYSKCSEESVLQTKMYFCQKNNFISREENPDKGVDLDVELIEDENVTGFKFALQIKSSSIFELVKYKDVEYIKYRIKTSRLGYICRRLPGMGLIILYEESTKKLYYDFVENIFQRINDFKQTNSWILQNEVTFYIDKDNIIDNNNIVDIYLKFSNRKRNTLLMYKSNSFNFDIPTLSSNLNDSDSDSIIVEFYHLFNNREFTQLLSLIKSINLKEIQSDINLLFLATLTYYETANYVEYKYLYKKCLERLHQLNCLQIETLKYTNINCNKVFGVDKTEIKNQLVNLLKSCNNQDIKFQVSVDLFFYETNETGYSRRIDLLDIKANQLEKILNSTLRQSPKFPFYCIQLSSIFQQLGLIVMLRNITEYRIKARIVKLVEADIDHFYFLLNKSNSYFEKSFSILNSILKNKEILNPEEINIHLMLHYAINFILLNIGYSGISNSNEFINVREFNDNYKIYLDNLKKVYKYFMSHNEFFNALKSLYQINELHKLYSYINKTRDIDDEIEVINEKISEIELTTGISSNKSIIDKIISSNGDEYDLKNESDHVLEQYATQICKILNLPIERKENLILDFKNIREFENNCNTQYFELLQNLNHTKSKETLYNDELRYIIRCKKCGYKTKSSSNIQELLDDLNKHHGYYCF